MISKLTKVDTGLPGRPKTAVFSRIPKKVGLPGRMASEWNTGRTPRSPSTEGTRSKSPIDTPPETRTRSFSPMARSKAAANSSERSRAMP